MVRNFQGLSLLDHPQVSRKAYVAPRLTADLTLETRAGSVIPAPPDFNHWFGDIFGTQSDPVDIQGDK